MLRSIGKQPGGIQSVVKKETVPTSSPEEQERREQPIEPLSPRTRLMKRNIFLNSWIYTQIRIYKWRVCDERCHVDMLLFSVLKRGSAYEATRQSITGDHSSLQQCQLPTRPNRPWPMGPALFMDPATHKIIIIIHFISKENYNHAFSNWPRKIEKNVSSQRNKNFTSKTLWSKYISSHICIHATRCIRR